MTKGIQLYFKKRSTFFDTHTYYYTRTKVKLGQNECHLRLTLLGKDNLKSKNAHDILRETLDIPSQFSFRRTYAGTILQFNDLFLCLLIS